MAIEKKNFFANKKKNSEQKKNYREKNFLPGQITKKTI